MSAPSSATGPPPGFGLPEPQAQPKAPPQQPAIGPPQGFGAPEGPPRGFGPSQPAPTSGGRLEWNKFSVPETPNPSKAGQALFPVIDRIADAHGIPRNVMRTVASIESLWTNDPAHAGDPAGAYGPAQIEASNVSAVRKTNPHFDPTNPEHAFGYMANALASAYKQYGDWGLAAGVYNTGGGAIDTWLKRGGSLDDVNRITDGITGSTQDVRAYMLRVRAAAMGDAFDQDHRARVAAAGAAANKRVATMVAEGKRQIESLVTLSPSGHYQLKMQPALVDVQGPMQAIGNYFEIASMASPFLGALAGKHPVQPKRNDAAQMGMAAGVRAVSTLPGGVGAALAGALPGVYEAVGGGTRARSLGDIMEAEGDVLKSMRNPSSLALAEQRYSVGSPGLVEATQGRQYHPRVDAATRTLLDFIGPSGVWKGAKLLLQGARRFPTIDRAVGALVEAGEKIADHPMARELQTYFSPTAILRFASKDLGLDPAQATMAGRNYIRSIQAARANASAARRQIFGDLNLQQRVEVERRRDAMWSNDVHPNDNIPEPTKGPSLDDRARLLHGNIKQMDDMSRSAALIDRKRMYDSDRYIYRGGPRGDVYKFDAHSDVLDFYGTGGRGGGARAGVDTAGAQAGHKVHQTYDEAAAGGNLSSKYDPADNFQRFLETRGSRAALNDALSNLYDLGLGHEMQFRDPDSGVPLAGSLGISKEGRGEAGYNAAKNLGKKRDTSIPIMAAAKELGMSVEDLRSIQRANPQAAANAMREMERAIKLAAEGAAPAIGRAVGLQGKLDTASMTAEQKLGQSQAELDAAKSTPTQPVTKKTSEDAAAAAENFNNQRDIAMRAAQKASAEATGAVRVSGKAADASTAADVGKSVASAIYGPKSKMERRYDALEQQMQRASLKLEQKNKLKAAIEKHLEEHQYQTFKRIYAHSARQERQSGFVPGEDLQKKLQFSLPSLKPWFAYHSGLATFLQEQGATVAEGGDFARLVNGFNNLYRIGIIYNPVRHLFINMPFNFLASGGKVGNLLRGFTDHSMEWQHMAEEASAVQHVSSQPFFGTSSGTAFDTPMRDVYKEAYAKAKDAAKGDVGTQEMAGIGGLIDAGMSRLWEGNQKLVFDWGETRLATARFRQYVEEEGLSHTEAANKVAGMFGSALDVSKTGVEKTLHNALLFYPWLKATVPLMMRGMFIAPEHVFTPYMRSPDWNRATQDPRWRSNSEGTYHLGKWYGKDVYMSWIGPQKYLEDIMSVFDPHGESTGGIGPRMGKLVNLAMSELKPSIGVPADVVATHLAKPAEPGPPNFSTLWNNAAPPSVQLSQATTSLLQRLPFGNMITGAVENAKATLGGDPSSVLSLMSIVPYDRPAPNIEKAQRKFFDAYVTQSGKIEASIRNIQQQPGLPAIKELRTKAMRDQQMIAYVAMKTQAQIIDPSLSKNDKKQIHAQMMKIIEPLKIEATALNAGAMQLQHQMSQQHGRGGVQPPAPNPTQALPTAPPGFGPPQP